MLPRSLINPSIAKIEPYHLFTCDFIFPMLKSITFDLFLIVFEDSIKFSIKARGSSFRLHLEDTTGKQQIHMYGSMEEFIVYCFRDFYKSCIYAPCFPPLRLYLLVHSFQLYMKFYSILIRASRKIIKDSYELYQPNDICLPSRIVNIFGKWEIKNGTEILPCV